jgi:hypothetical protein
MCARIGMETVMKGITDAAMATVQGDMEKATGQ